LLLPVAFLGLISCATRDRLCVVATECGPWAICVAGRCQLQKATPAILETTDAGTPAVRRVLFAPTDLAYLAPALPPPDGSIPSVVTLGKDESARLLLRFEARIADSAKIIEAYLLLPRAPGADVDPTPITLHVLRVIDPWDSRSIRWALQPRTQDTGSPATVVTAAGRPVVRLDVRDLVSRWPRREKDEQGLAVVASSTSVTGTALAIGADVALEVYLKE
jgi:hypothetical protein